MARADERNGCERGADRTASDTVTPESTPPRRLPPGATVGRYVVVGCLGEGGMGVVYAAHDFALDRRVSLKLVRSGQGPAAELRRARLLTEAQALARIAHPNVVAVHDVGTFGDEVYVALEHVPGLTLGDWLRGAPRSTGAICEVFAQAGRGLAAVHAAGLVHRDVKPDNVLLGNDGRVRLADLGLAVEAGEDGDATAGTPGYMPLEQLRGEPVDARADQFAFAVALFEALTGERPYGPRGASRAVLLQRLTQGDPAEVPRMRGVPPTLRRALRRALSPAAGDRFGSLDDLLRALDRRPPDRRSATVPVGLSGLAVLFLGLLAAAAIPVDRDAPSRVGSALPPRDVPGPAPAADRDPLRAAAPRSAPARIAPGASPAAVVERTTGDAAAASATPGTGTPRPWSWDGWARGNGPAAGSGRASGGSLFPGTNPALESLVESLQGLVKSLRAALEGETHTLFAGGTALASAAPGDAVRAGAVGLPGVGGGEPVQADGSALRTAAIGQLEQKLQASIDRGVPTDIAEARFALAQALAADPSQQARALALAEQARADLDTGGTPDPRTEALRTRLQDWIEAHQSYHTPGAGGGGGNLVRSDGDRLQRLTSP